MDDRTQSAVVLSKGTMIAHHKIISKIGAGGMGEVYLAEDTSLRRQVALKFMPTQYIRDENLKARFRREAQAAARLNHPNIVTVYEVGEHEGRPYFTMEHVEGNSLRSVVKKRGLRLREIVDLMVQVCEGLNCAHKNGVIHRDIKPSNIVLDSEGRPKLVDFGLAAVGGSDRLTKTGSTLGTIGYMSPEMVRGEEADVRSDIFSLGVVLYEMITARAPFDREYDVATINAILNEEPDPLNRYRPDLPSGLQRMIETMLAKDRGRRYQRPEELLNDLMVLRDSLDSESRQASTEMRKRRMWLLSPAAAIIAVGLLFLTLKPWRFDISPSQEAAALGNRLVIMYFANIAGELEDLRLGEIATDLLITDMSESQHFQVVSSQRLYDVLKLLGREGEKRFDRSVAFEVARKAGARWMLSGNILQVEPRIVMTSQLVDVATGDAMAAQKITGEPQDDIFLVVDKMSARVRESLPLAADMLQEPDRPVTQVTTASLEAYRYYLEGKDAIYTYNWLLAAEKLRQALDFDSTFAAGHLLLATAQFMLKDPEAAVHVSRAMKYRDRANTIQKYYIEALSEMIQKDYSASAEALKDLIKTHPDEKFAYFWLGATYRKYLRETETSIAYFEKAIELDSLFVNAYEQLAAAYHIIGDSEKSARAIDRCITLAPEWPYPYHRKGLVYHSGGEIDSAIAMYEKALEKEPDYYPSLENVASLYLKTKDYNKAEEAFGKLSAGPEKSRRSNFRTSLAVVQLCQGKLDKALEILDDGIAADRDEQTFHGAEGDMANKYMLKATIYVEKKDYEAALREIKQAMDACHRVVPIEAGCYLDDYVRLRAETGDISGAMQVAENLKDELTAAGEPLGRYWYALGLVSFSEGEFEKAEEMFGKSIQIQAMIDARFMLGKTYFESGQFEKAVVELEKIAALNQPYVAIWIIKSHHYLGLAYERLGQDGRAGKQFEAILGMWKDADPWIKEIADARLRIEQAHGGML